MSFSTKLGIIEPIPRKLFTAIGHVFTAEDAELEHLFRRKLRLKARIEVLQGWSYYHAGSASSGF